ncbi:hypothetical protein D3C71_879850 [compost metagenome]
MGKDTKAVVLGKALQIYRDVDAQLSRHSSDVDSAQLSHIDEMIEACAQALPHCIICGGAERKRKPLKSIMVMGLKELRHEKGGGMVVEVRRVVTDTDLSSARAWGNGPQGGGLRKLKLHGGLGRLLVQLRRVEQRERNERLYAQLTRTDAVLALIQVCRQVPPVAGFEPTVHKMP